jgi:hypothetical protein
MTISSDAELQDAETKLSDLKQRYQTLQQETDGDAELRDVTLRGLQQFINQLTIEISRYHVIKLASK